MVSGVVRALAMIPGSEVMPARATILPACVRLTNHPKIRIVRRL
jgi:hypothetical protein